MTSSFQGSSLRRFEGSKVGSSSPGLSTVPINLWVWAWDPEKLHTICTVLRTWKISLQYSGGSETRNVDLHNITDFQFSFSQKKKREREAPLVQPRDFWRKQKTKLVWNSEPMKLICPGQSLDPRPEEPVWGFDCWVVYGGGVRSIEN